MSTSAPAPRPRPLAARLVAPAASAGLALALGLALVPAVVNGDGLGYLKAAPTGLVVPGHLGYLPLVRFVGRLLGREGSLALLGPATALSLACGVVAAALVAEAARRMAGARASLVAGLGFAASFGALEAASDVEAYAPALAALSFALWAATGRRAGGGLGWVAATAASVAAASLLHVENVLCAPAAALLCALPPGDGEAPREAARGRLRRGDAIAVLLGSGALVLAAYLAAFHARGDDARGALRWVFAANHGFSYPLRWSSPAVAVYGMAKTLVYAPYPHQASWARVLGEAALGTACLAALLWLARRPGRAPTLGPVAMAAWLVPYAAVGVAFFASDNERWLFLLPPVWIAAGAGAATGERARTVAVALIAALVAGDLALGVPRARDASIRDRAVALAPLLRAGDLVVSPGHSWDEYLGFYESIPVDRFPMIYFCGQLGGAGPMRDELARRVRDARARGARVFFARADEPAGSDGWKELARFGPTPDRLAEFLPAVRRVPVAAGLERLDAPAP